MILKLEHYSHHINAFGGPSIEQRILLESWSNGGSFNDPYHPNGTDFNEPPFTITTRKERRRTKKTLFSLLFDAWAFFCSSATSSHSGIIHDIHHLRFSWTVESYAIILHSYILKDLRCVILILFFFCLYRVLNSVFSVRCLKSIMKNCFAYVKPNHLINCCFDNCSASTMRIFDFLQQNKCQQFFC